jgi:xanthine dehydrogenase accessory factor
MFDMGKWVCYHTHQNNGVIITKASRLFKRTVLKGCIMLEHYKNILEEISHGHRAVLVTSLSADAMPEKTLLAEPDLSALPVTDTSAEVARAAIEKSSVQCVALPGGGLQFAEPFVPEPRLIILGGGHIALPLCEFAAKCGFRVVVVDDRPSFANKVRFPLAADVICDSFDRAIDTISPDRFSFMVVITRVHRHDADCLRRTLSHDVAYVGQSVRRASGIVLRTFG